MKTLSRTSALFIFLWVMSILLAPTLAFAANSISQHTPSFNSVTIPGESVSSQKMLSADGQYVTAMWVVYDQGVYTVRVASSVDGGASFSSPQTIGTRSGWIIPVQIKVSNARVVALWLAEQGSDNSDLFVARSIDGGVTYSSPVNISKSPSTPSNLSELMIVNGDNVTVIWGEDDGLAGIYAATSFDGGVNFEDPIPLSDRAGGRVYGPTLEAGLPNTLYAAWQWEKDGDVGIDFTKSTNNGLSFDPPENVLPGHCCIRTLLAHNGSIFLQSASGLRATEDNGVTWQWLYPGLPRLSSITHAASTLYVDGRIWHEDGLFNSLHIASSSDGGITFNPFELGKDNFCGWGQGTSASGQTAATWWIETDPDTNGCSPFDIRNLVLRTTNDNGQSYGEPLRLPVGLSGRFYPSVLVSQRRIVVVWASYLNETDLNAPLYFSYSKDGGTSFSEVLLASNLRNLGHPPYNVVQNGEITHVITETSDGIIILTENEKPVFQDGFEG